MVRTISTSGEINSVVKSTVWSQSSVPHVEPDTRLLPQNHCGMTPSYADTFIYTRYQNSKLELIIMIYIDDIILMTQSQDTLKMPKGKLNNKLNMKYLGEIRWFLGIRINERPVGWKMTQTAYVDKVLTRFKMTDAKYKEISISPEVD